MKRIIVKGKVQGVFFRYQTEKKAQELGITGTVRNMIDGNVEIVAKGNDDAMRAFIDWCKVGPDYSRVDELKIENLPDRELEGFKILF